MSTQATTDRSPGEALEEALLGYLEAEEAGRAEEAAVWLHRFPELGPELEAFHAAVDRVDRVVTPFRRPAEDGPLPLAPGTRVGEYEILEFLAHGGMGTVYRARQDSLNREVALKMLRTDRSPPTRSAASARRPSWPPAWTTPTSSRSTRCGSTTGSPTSA